MLLTQIKRCFAVDESAVGSAGYGLLVSSLKITTYKFPCFSVKSESKNYSESDNLRIMIPLFPCSLKYSMKCSASSSKGPRINRTTMSSDWKDNICYEFLGVFG